jgi:Lipase maturation factor
VAATLVIEIPLAVLLIFPFKRLRRIGAAAQILLQALIMLTGNYNFFNILTIGLMLPVWGEDGYEELQVFFQAKIPKRIRTFLDSFWGLTLQTSVFLLLLSASIWSMFAWNPQPFSDSTVQPEWWMGSQLSMVMTWEKMSPWIGPTCAFAVICCCGHLFLYLLWFLVFCVAKVARSKVPIWHLKKSNRVPALFDATFHAYHGSFLIVWILLSATGFSGLGDTSWFIPSPIERLAEITRPFQLVSGYGLFRRMTGVGEFIGRTNGFVPSVTARPELVLEAQRAGSGEWVELPFRFKPTDMFQMPPVVAPHQPRLDWQMWFAALGNYQSNPWLVHLIHKLLSMHPDPNSYPKRNRETREGNDTALYVYPEVMMLLDVDHYPFPVLEAPAAIRAVLYDYDFTRLDEPWSRALPSAKIIRNLTLSEFVRSNLLDSNSTNSSSSNSSSTSTSSTESNTDVHSTSAASTISAGSNIPDKKSRKKREKSGSHQSQWWYRRNRREYLPPLDLNNTSVMQFLNANGITPRSHKSQTEQYHECLAIRQDRSGIEHNGGPQGSFYHSNLYGDTYISWLAESSRQALCAMLLLNQREGFLPSNLVELTSAVPVEITALSIILANIINSIILAL